MAMNNWGGVKEHMTRKNRKFLSEKRGTKKYLKKPIAKRDDKTIKTQQGNEIQSAEYNRTVITIVLIVLVTIFILVVF